MRSTSVPADPASRRRRRVENLQAQLAREQEQLEDAKRHGRGDVVAALRVQVDKTRRALSRARVRAAGPVA